MRTDPFTLIPSPLGLDNYYSEDAEVYQPTVSVGGDDGRLVGSGQPIRLRTASNVDITYEGEVALRRGFASTAISNGQDVLGINGSVYYQANGTFYKNTPATAVSLVTGLLRKATVITAPQGLFISDGTTHRQVINTTAYVWGQAAPTLTLGTGSGTLAAGTYLVQATFVDTQGNEGPASAVAAVTASANTGITVTATIPTGSASLNVYVSGVNQPQPNYLVTRTQAQLPYTISSVASTLVGAAPVTAQMSGPISGLVGGVAWRSFILLWRDNFIIRSEAFEPHLYHPNNIMQFPSTVRAVAGVDDGIWVGTESGVWWVTGQDPGSFVPFKKLDVEVLAGSLAISSDNLPVAELAGDLGVFVTRDGLVALGATGQLRWLTKQRYTFSGTSASLAFAQKGELRQIFVVT